MSKVVGKISRNERLDVRDAKPGLWPSHGGSGLGRLRPIIYAHPGKPDHAIRSRGKEGVDLAGEYQLCQRHDARRAGPALRLPGRRH